LNRRPAGVCGRPLVAAFFFGNQWPGSVEASVSDRYPAFTVHYRARFAELERILIFGVFKTVKERLSMLNWWDDELIHQFPEEIDVTIIHLRWAIV
jgi:hypothetical protein